MAIRIHHTIRVNSLEGYANRFNFYIVVVRKGCVSFEFTRHSPNTHTKILEMKESENAEDILRRIDLFEIHRGMEFSRCDIAILLQEGERLPTMLNEYNNNPPMEQSWHSFVETEIPDLTQTRRKF